jgi:hypothetical protein
MFSFLGLKQPWKDRSCQVIQPEIPGIGARGPAKSMVSALEFSLFGQSAFSQSQKYIGPRFFHVGSRCSAGNEVTHGIEAALRFEIRQVYVAILRFTHDLPISFDSVPLKLLSEIQGPL